jgi:hypothetical protein
VARYPLDNALFNWEAGARHLARIEAGGGAGGALRTVGTIRDEIRRRIGVTFSAAELADFYGRGTDWVRQLDGVDPAAPDLQELIDAAFREQLKAASNFAGGRLLDVEGESGGGDAFRPAGS